MLRAFANAFKIPDLRGKILFTLAIIAVYRLGSFIPIPGVDYGVLRGVLEQFNATGIGQILNLFSGGALSQLAVFALGIMPYITASIIMQLLTVVIPKLEEWQKEGETGTKRITQYTRYLTIALAILQSTALIVLIQSGQLFQGIPEATNLIPNPSVPIRMLMVLTLTAGTAFIMWLGELITQRGIGNGMSLIIFSAIVSELPSQGNAILQRDNGEILFPITMLVGLLLVVGVVFVEQGQRRIPVQYAKRQVGRRTYGGTSTYIPLKVNQSGVIPIIFASSLLYLPTLLASIIGRPGVQTFVDTYFAQGNHPLYIATFFLLVVFFAYFYTSITFNPIDVADNMKKYGGFIPGIRPGRPTADYLDRVLTRITLPGSLYLAGLAILPLIVLGIAGVQFPFGGSTLLIVVGVGLETMKQLESQLLQRHYEGFLKT
ncbi:MAG: preprotein translocase subunit SecY [Actinomycetota bacterium]|jgi:preprotein translocase subunit SecY|nr:preprotein translocase subunit SecY [Euzebyaceae bacterium]MDQ3451163.1 preprotein translocase subunit SecY [Actinomycetota bacterium]